MSIFHRTDETFLRVGKKIQKGEKKRGRPREIKKLRSTNTAL